ncbi:MAG: hypothetical protein A3A61_03720 [Candidatus Woykebacteria bacterium RIFCSPLOWO2_01_FULL_43_14]|uniref:Uncharacterized protein n=1 Tax=Candidatus Woykebacteria bacterium RIFCSPLOWO2_01_FULL_43_14 TaxID=1802605 RepID=A0A1G1WY11_9BACT|nr:MAG: hypothetical protein A3A61_03720 [Candidatus Woykebacteria bacterium RIFCSPLOWO2_01_FULL_43_14]
MEPKRRFATQKDIQVGSVVTYVDTEIASYGSTDDILTTVSCGERDMKVVSFTSTEVVLMRVGRENARPYRVSRSLFEGGFCYPDSFVVPIGN